MYMPPYKNAVKGRLLPAVGHFWLAGRPKGVGLT